MERHGEMPALIVEDDLGMRQLLETVLVEDGLPVAVCSNGFDALAWLEQRRPALILLDLSLPRMPGEAVAHNARQRYGQTLPILVVTGDIHARERTEQAEAFVYLTKPFDNEELLRVVHALINPEAPLGVFTKATSIDEGCAQR